MTIKGHVDSFYYLAAGSVGGATATLTIVDQVLSILVGTGTLVVIGFTIHKFINDRNDK
jgi:hypothetical protein